MAYAATVTLLQILNHILHPHLDQHQIPHDKHQIQSLQKKLIFFHDFLEGSWQKQGRVVQCLEKKIRAAAHKAQDTIEFYISKHFLPENEKDRETRCKVFVQDLELVIEEIDSINKKVSILMDSWRAKGEHRTTSSPAQPSRWASTNENFMVGFDNDLVQLKDRLTSNQSKLQIIPIVGMGGTGKTTLTKNLYSDDYIVHYFDIRAWVIISQKYQKREILLGLLESMRKLTVEMCQESDDYLSECLYKSLKGRRYLIVMDDVWSTEVMDEMKSLFPDDNTGSRIVVTTRLSEVAAYADSYVAHQHHMHFLSEHDSWSLLCRKVFVGECCPRELEEAGKKISQSCKGLPLAILVIAGLLTKVERTQRHWEHIARNVNSIVIANDMQCSEILSLSYSHLPHHLKACFLYMGFFPEDHKIQISKLIKLWVAEGFIKQVSFKNIEEVGEEYLEDLISRNLILVCERSSGGKIKTCSVHDLLRDLCLRKANEEKFLHAIPINRHSFPFGIKDPRRLTIHGGSIVREIRNSIGTLSLVRSLLCLSLTRKVILPNNFLYCKLLRVLDLGKLDFHLFPITVLELVHLRFLAFLCTENFHIPEVLPDYLWNLQTLVIHQRGDHNRITGTQVFWRMPQLRHLQLEKFYLNCPYWENSFLENLQTLSKVTSASCSYELFKRIPNLMKLGFRVEVLGNDSPFSLGNLVNLSKLEKLKCIVDHGAQVSIPMSFTFPQSLKKLTLKHTRIPWKEMSVVGSLPNLQVLKLRDNAFEGQEWEPIDGEFCQLKSLLIDGAGLQYWRADKEHFPRLEHLSLFLCSKLEEIPCGVGEIPTLKTIELDDASPSAVTSAKVIQEEQQSLGNEAFQVSILYVGSMYRINLT